MPEDTFKNEYLDVTDFWEKTGLTDNGLNSSYIKNDNPKMYIAMIGEKALGNSETQESFLASLEEYINTMPEQASLDFIMSFLEICLQRDFRKVLLALILTYGHIHDFRRITIVIQEFLAEHWDEVFDLLMDYINQEINEKCLVDGHEVLLNTFEYLLVGMCRFKTELFKYNLLIYLAENYTRSVVVTNDFNSKLVRDIKTALYERMKLRIEFNV